MKYPYMEFFTGDWLRDPAVGMLSPAARGIWVDLMCAMHQDDRSGVICGTSAQLARLARCSTDEMGGALEEFRVCKTGEVSEDNGMVTVINRRMHREAQARKQGGLRQARFRGKGEGNALKTEGSRPILQASESESEYSDKASKVVAQRASAADAAGEGFARGPARSAAGLTSRQLEVAQFAESVLNGQWVNDAGKWVERIKGDADKVWRVMADVKSAVVERRVKTSPAQMAEHNWKVFK
jgi:uncharacterized protein YdaU (DUF1376 family)